MNRIRWIAGFALALVAAAAPAAEKEFKIVGERLSYRNVASVESESDFETFTGRTNGVSGAIRFDPVTKRGSGKIVIDVASIDTGIAVRNEHMRGEGWMNSQKFPTITFATTKVERQSGDTYRVTGKLTLHGVTRSITTTAKVRYRAAGPQAKQAGFEGDVIQISSKFGIKLSDFGIVIPAAVKGKVSNDVTLSISAYATAN